MRFKISRTSFTHTISHVLFAQLRKKNIFCRKQTNTLFVYLENSKFVILKISWNFTQRWNTTCTSTLPCTGVTVVPLVRLWVHQLKIIGYHHLRHTTASSVPCPKVTVRIFTPRNPPKNSKFWNRFFFYIGAILLILDFF